MNKEITSIHSLPVSGFCVSAEVLPFRVIPKRMEIELSPNSIISVRRGDVYIKNSLLTREDFNLLYKKIDGKPCVCKK